VYMLCWCSYKHRVTSNTVGFCSGCVDAGFVLLLSCHLVYGCWYGTGVKAILEVFYGGD